MTKLGSRKDVLFVILLELQSSCLLHLPTLIIMAEAARVALRSLAASTNALNKNTAVHTPLVLGSLGASCVLSWVYGAAFLVDSEFSPKVQQNATGFK